MITTTQQPQTNYSKTNFIPLEYLPHGTGEVGRYLPEVEGILVGLEARGGTYSVKDRKTGETITRPNSWTAHFADGSMWSWPTYLGEDGKVYPWSRFDPSIDLVQCIQQQKVIHVWKDEDNFCHLELVETTSQGINPSVTQAAQPQQPTQMATSFAQQQPQQQVAQQFVPQQQAAPQQQAQAYRMPWD